MWWVLVQARDGRSLRSLPLHDGLVAKERQAVGVLVSIRPMELAHVVGVRRAEKRVEPLIGRKEPVAMTEMPFSEAAGDVAGAGQYVGDGDFVGMQPVIEGGEDDPATGAGDGRGKFSGGAGMGMGMGAGEGADMGDSGAASETANSDEDPNIQKVYEYTFVVQMAWTPRSEKERLEARTARLAKDEADKNANADETETVADEG